MASYHSLFGPLVLPVDADHHSVRFPYSDHDATPKESEGYWGDTGRSAITSSQTLVSSSASDCDADSDARMTGDISDVEGGAGEEQLRDDFSFQSFADLHEYIGSTHTSCSPSSSAAVSVCDESGEGGAGGEGEDLDEEERAFRAMAMSVCTSDVGFQSVDESSSVASIVRVAASVFTSSVP